MPQHTPGPWATSKGAYGALHVGPAKLDHPGREAAQYAAEHGRDLLAQRAADAALIAAAPEMLAALQDIADFWEEPTLSLWVLKSRVSAAIAKAKGGAA
jgi:hypothetical protein